MADLTRAEQEAWVREYREGVVKLAVNLTISAVLMRYRYPAAVVVAVPDGLRTRLIADRESIFQEVLRVIESPIGQEVTPWPAS